MFVKGMTRLQAVQRASKVRKLYRHKMRNAAYRESVAREIYSTEKSYVNNLDILVRVFLEPMKVF